MNDLKTSVRTVPDFPIKGIQFRDITSLLEDPTAFNQAINTLALGIHEFKGTIVVGIESRVFVFGAPLANILKLPFVMARKPGKLPNKTFKKEHKLEYGSSSLEIQKNSKISPTDRVIILDDLIATGGTAMACASLIHEQFNVPKSNILIQTVIDLPGLKGSALIRENGYHIQTIIEFD